MSRDQSGSLDESLLVRDNSLTPSLVKTSEGASSELGEEMPAPAPAPSTTPDWSPPPPLQLSSYNLSAPPPLPLKPLRTETLERHPAPATAPAPARHLHQLRTFTSGRASAEPLDTFKLGAARPETEARLRSSPAPAPGSQLTTSLSELDLRYPLKLIVSVSVK